ncbi:MAG TPA: hypothetical protein VGK13_03870 [Methanocellaceae archaeon]
MSKHNALFIVIFIAIAISAIVAIAAASSSAQRTAGGEDPGSLPVSLFIDNAMSAHEQDIKDRMLDYEFNHTTSESARADIVKERGDELNAVVLDQQAFLKALKNDTSRGLIPGDRLNAMLNVTKDSIKRISKSSDHLQEKSQKIKGHEASGTVDPLIVNINTASLLADNISRGDTNKSNAGVATQDKPLKHPDNPKGNK